MNTQFARNIESWYQANGRRLPWRETRDAYHIWISEVILQQTRVVQGYDYYLRFISQFPTVDDLANATEDQVLRAWQGLGYYSRARNLHAAACQIQENGGFPQTYDEILALRGVGEYTAAAIASIAYDLPHAVLDGNVYRVLSRHFGIYDAIDTTAGHRIFRALADEMLDAANPSLYNQGIMDFGAMVCTPRNPACGSCPLSDTCVALADGKVGDTPVKSHVTRVRDRYFCYFFLQVHGQVLVQRRPAGDIWQGLYQLPLIETVSPMNYAQVSKRLPGHTLHQLAQGITHQLSHQLLHADLYAVTDADDACGFQGAWTPLDQLQQLAFPRLLLTLLEKIPATNLGK